MHPHDLLKTAHDLVNAANGKPRQSNLLRATSTAYYALFHTLAYSCADLLIGGTGSERSGQAWNQVYRALEHSSAKRSCQHSDIAKFPKEIQDFADKFIIMQEKRHLADYDPNEKAFKSSVLSDLWDVKKVIDDFGKVPVKDHRAFAAFVLFKKRRV